MPASRRINNSTTNLYFYGNMLITKEWSRPRQVVPGKKILVRSSHSNFDFLLVAANGRQLQGTIHARIHIIEPEDLLPPGQTSLLSFRANTQDELHVDFEQLEL